jgi:hypothetical protein
MRPGLILLSAFALAGAGLAGYGYWKATAEPDSVRLCEFIIVGSLRSPASYERIEVGLLGPAETARVAIFYDAQNVYGAVIRSHAVCVFKPGREGHPIIQGVMVDGEYLMLHGVRQLERRWEAEHSAARIGW